MKIIVTHRSPDLDAIASVWLIQKFLPQWRDAKVEFVSAGDRLHDGSSKTEVIENMDGNEIIHVDTGLGVLDHHQLETDEESAASLTWEFIQGKLDSLKEIRKEAVSRLISVVVQTDHFKEVFWENPTADYCDFSVSGVLEGLKLTKPNDDRFYIEFISQCLDKVLVEFETKIGAEKDIKEKGIEFKTRFGKGIGIESGNDAVIKLSQKMGYAIAVRKDPEGYIRIKATPSKDGNDGVDLTPIYKEIKKREPETFWFLHINKKMLLNGSSKTNRMKPTKLSLDDIIKMLEKI